MAPKRKASEIDRVGVELEGGWHYRPDGMVPDGSVSTEAARSGEVPSPPLDRADLAEWVRAHYPDVVNSTCGLHVHMSFTTSSAYSYLMTHAERLQDTLVANLLAWGEKRTIREGHPFWARLNGENGFCRSGGNPDQQARARGKSHVRYHMLNFCHRLHGTLEVRVLPGFKKVDLAIEAINVVLDTVAEMLRHEGEGSAPTVPATVETAVGTIDVKRWAAGARLTLQAAPAVKRAVLDAYRYVDPSSLAVRLCKRQIVCLPPSTEALLKVELDRCKADLDTFTVTVARRF